MRVLFDTHTLAWWLLDDLRLSRKVRELAISPETEVWVSAVSAFEIATKFRNGKWPEAGRLAAEIEKAVAAENFQTLPVTATHARRGGLLNGAHHDPFDRLLAAQSLVEDMPLATNDEAFSAFGVDTIW